MSLNACSILFMVWTHRVCTRADPDTAQRIAMRQYRRGPSHLSQAFGFRDESNWATMAAVTALIVAVAAAVTSAQHESVWLPVLVLITAATSWATMAYAFAPRYFRRRRCDDGVTRHHTHHCRLMRCTH